MPRATHRTAVRFPLALLAFAWCSLATGAAPAPVTVNAPLTEYARNAIGKEFYGAYLFGTKAGWISDETRMAQVRGTPVYENVSEVNMDLAMQGQRLQKMVRTITQFALDADGAIIAMSESDKEDGNEVQRTAVREGKNLRITTQEQGKTTERTVPLPRATLKAVRDVEIWLAKSPRKGEKITTYDVDLSAEDVESATVMEFVESTPLVWGGIAIQASRVKVSVDGAEFEALAGPDGKLLQGKLGGLLEFRAEEEQLAKARNDKPIDMLAASSIVVAQPLGDRNRISALTLELSGPGASQIPASARQRVRSSNGTTTVELLRESPQPAAARLTQQERERFLRATPSIQSDDEQIRKLAREIVGNEKEPVKVAGLIVDWIGRNLRKQYGANASTATAVLRQKSGDCTEHTLLFTALARALGIPTRQLGGIMYVETPAPIFGWHAWAEIHDGTGWVAVDPTWNQVRVDPTHVQFSFFGDDLEKNDMGWIQALGSLKIEVKKVERS